MVAGLVASVLVRRQLRFVVVVCVAVLVLFGIDVVCDCVGSTLDLIGCGCGFGHVVVGYWLCLVVLVGVAVLV